MTIAPINLSIAQNVFDSFVTWVANIVADLVGGVSSSFTEATMPSMTVFNATFPFMKTAFTAVTYFAYALLFLIVVFQLVKCFGGKIVEGEDPMVLTVRAMFFAMLIPFAGQIMDIVLDIAMVPFEVFSENGGYITDAVQKGTFAGLLQGDKLVFSIIFGAGSLFSGIGTIIGILLTVVLFWNYLKLLLEVCERYVVLGILYYTSPLAFSLGASKATSDTFKNWCRMVGSQLFVIVMNVYFLRGFGAALGVFIATCGTTVISNNNMLVTFMIGYFSLLAYLRVAARFDEYLGQLGLNAAKTGTGPLGGFAPMMAARMMLPMGLNALGGAGILGGGGGFFGGRTGGGIGAAGKVLGTSGIGTIPSRVGNAFKPDTYVNNALGGKKEGFHGVAGAMANMAGRAYVAKNGLNDIGRISDFANSTNQGLNSIGGQAGLNDAQKFMPGLFNRQGLAFNAGEQLNSAGRMAGQFTDAQGNTYKAVATSMQANEAPSGAFGVMRAADGSGFYVQTLDKDGNVSEAGMASIFGAPEIAADAGADAQTAFANDFFPGQDGAEGLTFSSDANDPFTLNATDADGNMFAFRSGVAYDMPEDAVEGMSLTDANGQEWFAQDVTPVDTSAIEGGVSIGSDGTITDSMGNVVSDDVIGSVGMGAPVIADGAGETFASEFFPDNALETSGMSFSNVDGDPYSLRAVDDYGNEVMFRSSLAYGDSVGGEELTDINGNTWYRDDGIFTDANEGYDGYRSMSLDADNPYSMTVQDTDVSGNPVGDAMEYRSTAAYDMPEGVDSSQVITDDYGQTWFPVTAGGEEAQAAFGNDYSVSYNPLNPYEATITDADGNVGRYQNFSALDGKDGYTLPEGVDSSSAIEDNFGNKWYPVTAGVDERLQRASIERSNQSVADFYGLDSSKIQYADTSRQSEGIVSVLNKDGSAQMYVAQKGQYEVKGDYKEVTAQNGQSWYQINGTRGVTQRDTGRRDAEGKPITTPVGTVRYDSRPIRKQPKALENKFSPKKNSRSKGGRRKK